MTDIEILKEECRNFGACFIDIDTTYPHFYHHLNQILKRPPHENIEQICGYYFTNNFTTSLPFQLLQIRYEHASDGESIFDLIVQENPEAQENFQTLIFNERLSQYQLLTLVEDKSSILVIKTLRNVRIYYDGVIYLIEGRNWRIYKKIDEHVTKLEQHFSALNKAQFFNILSFAFHDLSLNKIGTTIVYYLSNSLEIPNTTASKAAEIDFKIENQKQLLKNYLTYNDGAIAINLDGIVCQTNIFLNNSDLAHRFVKSHSGTRHTSAAKYSFDNPETIVVTVSADGPVSIFSEGCNIENINVEFNYRANDGIHEMVREHESSSWEDEDVASCPTCGRKYIVNILTVSGWRDPESIDCDVCGTEYYHKRCFKLEHRLIKKLA